MVENKIKISSQNFRELASFQCKCFAEIGNHHIALIVCTDGVFEAFEYYEIEVLNNNWDTIFNSIKNQSIILDKSYALVNIHYNLNEALVVPSKKYSEQSIEFFIQSVYGEQKDAIYLNEKIAIPEMPFTIFGVQKTLHEVVKKVFGQCNFSHSYTKLIENTLGKETMILEMLKVQFYPKHMIVHVVFGNKLALIQSYLYNNPEDVIYYLLNIVQEFGLSVANTPIEISGVLGINSKHFELLENLFSRLSLETVNTDSIFKENISVANAHFYTPFTNLVS